MVIFTKIFRRFIYTITIIVLICGAIIIGPKLFGFTPYIATSGSMEPTIPTGSLVYINTKNTNVKTNDIITFKIIGGSKQKLVTHRAVEVKDNEITTKGDANDNIDSKTITNNQVIGKYAYHIPQLGYIYDKLGHKVLIAIVAWIIILNCVVFLLSYLFPDKPKEKKTEQVSEVSNETEKQKDTSEKQTKVAID